MYGLRGCAPCDKLHGVRLIKGIKVFESMLTNQNLSSLPTKSKSQHELNWSIIIIN